MLDWSLVFGDDTTCLFDIQLPFQITSCYSQVYSTVIRLHRRVVQLLSHI